VVKSYRQDEGEKTDSREVVFTDRFNTSAQLKLKRIIPTEQVEKYRQD
jgi:hypothetical protein